MRCPYVEIEIDIELELELELMERGCGGEDSFRHDKSCHLPQRWRLIEKKCGFLKLYILRIYKSLTFSNAFYIV